MPNGGMTKKSKKQKQTPAEVVGQLIRHWRRSAEVTQVELSNYLEISQSTMSKIEAGLLEPGLFVYGRLCRRAPVFHEHFRDIIQ